VTRATTPPFGPVDDHSYGAGNVPVHGFYVHASRRAGERERELHLRERNADARASTSAVRHPRTVDCRLPARVGHGPGATPRREANRAAPTPAVVVLA
jgi:hypothetical protein